VLVTIVLVGVGIAYLIIQSNKNPPPDNAKAQAIENDKTWAGPGQFVDLPQAFADGSTLAHYGASSGPTTNGHVTHNVDYSKEISANSSTGLPPAGGPHWGSTGCGTDPTNAPAYCGPVPWGAYRQPWPAESLVHSMEHGGIVVWYNSTDTKVRDDLENWVIDEGNKGKFVVLTPYPDLPPNTVALTAWARRDIFPTSDLTEKRVKDFIDKLNCRFNPEHFKCS
jgi:hypothetical protein